MEGRQGEQALLNEIKYLTNLIHSRGGRSCSNAHPCRGGIASTTSSSQYHWNRQLSSKIPSALQNPKNLLKQRPCKEAKKIHVLQKLAPSYNVLQPVSPHHKKHSRSKVPVNPTSSGTKSHEAVVHCVKKYQSRMSSTVFKSPCSSSGVREVHLKTVSARKVEVQVTPVADKSQAHPKLSQNTKPSKKKKKKPIPSKKCLPSRSQLKWRRELLDDESSSTTPSTSAESRHSANPPALSPSPSAGTTASRKLRPSSGNVYKWKRRSSSGAKSVLVSPLVSHSKFKMTRASLLRKYNHVRHSVRVRAQHKYMRLRSLRPSLDQRLHRRPAKFYSKSKNKVWINSGAFSTPRGPAKSRRLSLASPFSDVLAGRETKTRHGNRQWVSIRHLQLTQQSFRKAALLSSAKRASLVTFEKGRYVLDPSRRRLKKVDSAVTLTPPSTPRAYRVNMEASVKRIRANHVIEKSRRYVWRARSTNKHERKKYCIFFNRFGKCNRSDKCPYVHDPDRIAICKKYLAGLCEKTDGTCPLSHKITKEKMPVCSFFLRGVCVRENCPYLHVSVGKDADICQNFVKGYCSKGEQCTKKHVVDCPEFLVGGECPRGKKCPLRHSKRVLKSVCKRKKAAIDVKQPRAFGSIRHRQSKQLTGKEEDDDSSQPGTTSYTSRELNFIPLELDRAPDFIAL